MLNETKLKIKIKTDEIRGLPTLTRAVNEIYEKLESADFGINVVYIHPKVDFYQLRDALLARGLTYDAHQLSFSF